MSQLHWSETLDPDLPCSRQDAELHFPKRSRGEDEVRALTCTSNSSLRKEGWMTINSQRRHNVIVPWTVFHLAKPEGTHSAGYVHVTF